MQSNPRSHNRISILAVCCLAFMAIFVGRLFYLQIIAHDKYVAMAKEEQVKRLVLPAERGEIYAMDGADPIKIVYNEVIYTVFVDPQIVDEPEKMIDTIRRVAGGNTVSDFEALLSDKSSRYAIVATEVTRKQADLMKKENLSGLGFEKGTRRFYPEGKLAAQTLGFVNAAREGQYGVEGELNERLTGSDGVRQSVTDVRSVPLTIGGDNIFKPAVDGDDVVLTIDRNIQSYTEKALVRGLKRSGADKASAIVMDPHSGKVLAMANLPTYSPSKYSQVKNTSVYNNDVVSIPYEPGSVMKTFTLATGVDQGVVTPKSTYNNTGTVTVGGRQIHNAVTSQRGVITMQHALDWSLNTGMVTVARRLGDGERITRDARNTMYTYLHDKFGLGERTGIEVSGEAGGVIVPPTESEGGAVRYSNMSFGQGMDLTMVQVAAGFCAIINGGTYYHPTVINGVMTEDGEIKQEKPTKQPRNNIIKQSTSATMKKMIHDARASFHGSTDTPGFYVGGKTGTSQTLDDDGRYVFDETIGTYIGYGGNADETNYVIMVQISGENMKMEGGTDAMPIFTDISNWLLGYMKVVPKG